MVASATIDPRLLAALSQPSVARALYDEIARRDFEAVCASPQRFREVLIIDKGAGQTGTLDASMDPWQRRDFEAMDPAWLTVVGRGSGSARFYASYKERARGHSKTTDIAATCTWALLSSSRKIRGVVASGSQEQAGFVRDAIDVLLRLNPWLGERLQLNKFEVINRLTGSSLKILAANESTNYGHTPDFAIIDELTHWENEGLWTSIFSATAKRPYCVLEVIANAGQSKGRSLSADVPADELGGSWHWRVRESCRVDPDWYFHRLEGCEASWITPAALKKQRGGLSNREYTRLWLNEWLATGSDKLDMEDVERCIVLPGPYDNAYDFDCCVGALDLSQTKHHSAFVIFGIDNKRQKVRLAQTRVWRPQDFPDGRIKLRTVCNDVKDLCNRYNVIGVAYDPAQAELLAEDLDAAGIATYRQLFTPPEKNLMARRMIAALRDQRIDLYRDRELIKQFGKLEIVDKNKRLAIVAPEDAESGHCDLAIAFSIGLPWALDTLEFPR